MTTNLSAREEILARVRRALADVPKDEPADVTRGYLREHGSLTEAQTIDLLAENLADYRAHVHRSSEAELPAAIARLLAEHGSTSVAIPEALPEAWLTQLRPETARIPDPHSESEPNELRPETARIPDAHSESRLTRLPAEITLVPDAADLTPRRLDEVHSVISACALAVAETGTIILDGGPGQGRRLLTLVPDHHICVIRVPDQVVASVPQALEGVDPTRPQTWIAGPSATSDIELDRVEGVHGPRTLDVILVSAT
jgi:L-lactate dehydrogenase complex protein LldG